MENTIIGWKRYALVQPPMMMLLFAQSLSGAILTDLIVYNTCKITLGINKTECMLLHDNSSSAEALRIDTQVQPQASLILMSKTFIESIFPAFLSLFLGPWSDKYGRKPLILSGFMGVSTTFILLAVMANWYIKPWFLLIAFIPSALSGGFCILLLASFCYITDITDNKNRAWQLAWLDALISLGILMGIFSGPVIFEAYGYTVVFGVAAIVCIIAGLYVLLCIPETIQNRTLGTLGSLFDISLVKDLVSTCIKKREGFDRRVVWCCIVCLTLTVVTMQGESTISYLFTSARLGWDVKEYCVFTGTSVILGIVGTVFGVKVIAAYTGWSETVIAILAMSSSISGAILTSFAWQSWHMYLATAAGMFGGVTGPVVRAILSKAAPSQDAGKVFSLTTSVETLTPFGASSLYAMIYSHYMPPLYPSPVWLVSAGFFAIIIMILISIQIHLTKLNNIQYNPLSQDNE